MKIVKLERADLGMWVIIKVTYKTFFGKVVTRDAVLSKFMDFKWADNGDFILHIDETLSSFLDSEERIYIANKTHEKTN